MDIKLGKKYKDSVSGFTGTATARAHYLSGCDRILLESMDKNKKILEYWFDINRIVGYEAKEEETGGPQSIPPSRNSF